MSTSQYRGFQLYRSGARWEAWRDGVRMQGTSERQIHTMIDLKLDEERARGGRWAWPWQDARQLKEKG